MTKHFIIILLIFFLLPNISFAKSKYFQEGIDLYNKKKFNEAKFKFEQDIVFNPKSELSYLYLSKIFNKKNKTKLEEQNLETVMLLNPKNEEAIYNLAKLKLKNSDFSKSKELNSKLKAICINFCNLSDKLRLKLKIYLK